MTLTESTTHTASRRVRRSIVAGAVLGAFVVSGLIILTGDSLGAEPLPGLPAIDPVPGWLSTALRVAGDLAAVATVGCLLGASVLDPGQGRTVSPHGLKWLGRASIAALLWAITIGVSLPVRLAELLGVGLGEVGPSGVLGFASDIGQGQALLLSLALSVVVAITARVVLSGAGTYALLLTAIVALLPPVFTGHSASSSGHAAATSSLAVHVVAVTLWAGGLLVLFGAWRMRTPRLTTAARRFSRLAGWCFVAVGLSGVVTAATRLTGPADLVGTAYGRLVLVKVAIFLVLGTAGWWHRKHSLAALGSGAPRAFLRLAGGELILLFAAIGVAVGLSRTETPPTTEVPTATEILLGYPMPGPLSLAEFLQPYPDVFFPTVIALAVGGYVAGLRRLRRAGVRWPPGRTVAWLSGWLLVLVVTSSGLARYGPVLTSVHMIQHMTLSMLAPVLLVLGAPMTLALRALRPASEPGVRGPREWISAALRTRTLRILSQPLVALTIYVLSLYGMYFSGLYELALRSHAAHLLMFAHFLLVGFLFFWVVIGIDPAPDRPAHHYRVLLLMIWIALHTIFALTLMQSNSVLAADWFASLERPWGASPLNDQQTAGGIAWGFGDIPIVGIMGALVAQWVRADRREQAQLDRTAARAARTGRPEDDPHERYNAHLRDLRAADQVRPGRPNSGR